MEQVGGFGLIIQIIASKTFPAGFTLTQFADDADPFDTPNIDIADTAMGLNGDMLAWSKPNVLKANINIIPKSDDDRNLSVLAEANRVGKGKASVRDVITMVVIYPDGSSVTQTPGAIISAPPSPSVSSAGRIKTRMYGFGFENKVEVAL
jgi:hypothetical protein